MPKTFVFLSSLFLCMLTLNCLAQKTKKIIQKDNTPLFNGLTIQGDVASVASSLLSNGETYSYEAAAQVDLKHKFYPIFELGYAGANKTSNDNVNFKTNGLFGRVGVDLNLLSPKKDEKPTSNLFLAGIRFGMSNFPYSITNVLISDNYWGGTESTNFDNKNATKLWYEIVVGVRVEVFKNIFMGWSVRSKNMLSQDVAGEVSPWYVPGFGTNTGSNWGFNYTIGYKIQISQKNRIPVKK
jgi:hypothetical protein